MKRQNHFARPHIVHKVKQALDNLEWGIFSHFAYSPDIVPPDYYFYYYLFRSMQHSVFKTYFQNEADVIKWIDYFIASRDETFFHHGICMLPKRWQKVVGINIKYFD